MQVCPTRDSCLLSQYGAKALDRVLSTILNHTENRVPVPESYDRGEAAFFHGKSITSCGVYLHLAGWVGLRFEMLEEPSSRLEQKVREREQYHWLSSSLVSRAIGHPDACHPARGRGKWVWDKLNCEITGTAGGEAALQDC